MPGTVAPYAMQLCSQNVFSLWSEQHKHSLYAVAPVCTACKMQRGHKICSMLFQYCALVQIPVLNEGIANFYDKSSGLWERMWGEHMHHGFYDSNSTARISREQAQIDMIDNVLKFAGVTTASSMVDVGCGIGGSSRCSTSPAAHHATLSSLMPVTLRGGFLLTMHAFGCRRAHTYQTCKVHV